MTSSFRRGIIAAITLALLSGTAIAQEATERDNIDVRRVTLATGGIAEVEGGVSQPTDTMRLAIERPQVADVLRTLVVTGDTPVVSVDLEAAQPVGARSVTGKLLAGDLSDPRTVLDSLIGEEVVLSGGPNRLAGRLLAYAVVNIPGDGENVLPRPGVRASVATADGKVAYATFPSLDALSIEGDAVDERMAALVPALGESVDDGRRELSITMAGEGEPGFSFVVPTTVWRPSYRATVNVEGDVDLQGWATLENTTGLDWDGIELRLAVGTPVAYAQDIYTPLRTERPTAPFEVGGTAQVPLVPSSDFDMMANGRADGAASQASGGVLSLEANAALPLAKERIVAGVQTGGPAAVSSASTVFPVSGRIDLAAGRTLSVPFLSAGENVDRVAYLDLRAGSGADLAPLDSLELSFDEEASVPGGLVAVYLEDGFAGDARFAGADGGERSILPFAASADLDASVKENSQRRLVSASMRSGALVVRRENLRTLQVDLTADGEQTLVLDLARNSNETIEAKGPGGVAVATERLDAARERVRAELPDGASSIVVSARQPISERYFLSNLPLPVIEEVLSLGDELDAATRQRLEQVGATIGKLAGIEREIDTLEAEFSDLREAVRLDRQNLETIGPKTPEGAEIRTRIIEFTNRINDGMAEIRELRRERAELRGALQRGDG